MIGESDTRWTATVRALHRRNPVITGFANACARELVVMMGRPRELKGTTLRNEPWFRSETALAFALILVHALGGCGKPTGQNDVTWEFGATAFASSRRSGTGKVTGDSSFPPRTSRAQRSRVTW